MEVVYFGVKSSLTLKIKSILGQYFGMQASLRTAAYVLIHTLVIRRILGLMEVEYTVVLMQEEWKCSP